jgi:hypothetical protein
VACLGPQTAPQVLPVEVPSAAGGRGTSKKKAAKATGACTARRRTRARESLYTDLNLLFLRSTASRGPQHSTTTKRCLLLSSVVSLCRVWRFRPSPWVDGPRGSRGGSASGVAVRRVVGRGPVARCARVGVLAGGRAARARKAAARCVAVVFAARGHAAPGARHSLPSSRRCRSSLSLSLSLSPPELARTAERYERRA